MSMSVKVQYESGKAVNGVSVTVWLDYEKGQATKSTDGNGKVYFDFGPGSGTIYVDGTEVRKGNLSAQEVVTYYSGRGYR